MAAGGSEFLGLRTRELLARPPSRGLRFGQDLLVQLSTELVVQKMLEQFNDEKYNGLSTTWSRECVARIFALPGGVGQFVPRRAVVWLASQ